MVTMQEQVSERVMQTVADSTGRDQLDLPPLYSAVDPDALNSVIESMAVGEVSFHYAGHEVTVTSNAAIRLSEFRVDPSTQ